MKRRTLLAVLAGLVVAMPLVSQAEVRDRPPPPLAPERDRPSPRARAAVFVFFGGAGSGVVSTPNNENNCGSDCTMSVVVPRGGTITLTATPRSSSLFAGWGGDVCSGTSPICVVTLSQLKPPRVFAYFRPGLTTLAVGAYHTCALRPTGAVVCWGLNTDGQTGSTAVTTRSEPPKPAMGITNAVAVAAGGYHTCALIGDGTVQCWGNNKEGEIGIARNDRNVPSPAVVPDITEAVAVTAGAFHTCVVRAGGTAFCWGQNLNGQLGDNSTTSSNAPVAVALGAVGPLANQITAGGFHTCAIVKADSTVVCWGMNNDGQLGIGHTSVAEPSPGQKVQIDASGCPSGGPFNPGCFDGFLRATKIAASIGVGQIGGSPLGGFFTVALDSNGQDFGWGDSGAFQIGITSSNRWFQTQAVRGAWFTSFTTPPLHPFGAQITAGAYHTCMRSPIVDSVFCRGNDNNGQSAPDPFDDTVPLPAGVVVDVGAGGYHTCAVIIAPFTESLACWGEDRDGQVTGNTNPGTNVHQNPVVVALPP
jgi:alpha-tubulin suppressor-like RCC1 family protein